MYQYMNPGMEPVMGVEPISYFLTKEVPSHEGQTGNICGPDRSRTGHLLLARQTLSQMSYEPITTIRVK
jgi:hypothetical protein